jgi:hypothetical protein
VRITNNALQIGNAHEIAIKTDIRVKGSASA